MADEQEPSRNQTWRNWMKSGSIAERDAKMGKEILAESEMKGI